MFYGWLFDYGMCWDIDRINRMHRPTQQREYPVHPVERYVQEYVLSIYNNTKERKCGTDRIP
jgi:hypothetical protein